MESIITSYVEHRQVGFCYELGLGLARLLCELVPGTKFVLDSSTLAGTLYSTGFFVFFG